MNRFWSKVKKTRSCWIWQACLTSRGYGRFNVGASGGCRIVFAHRFSYELLVGPIPKGLELDHVCRNKSCVNPRHLKPVTHRQNLTAPGSQVGIPSGQLKLSKTHCPSGHELSGDNVRLDKNGHRKCKTCLRDRNRNWYRQKNNLPETKFRRLF